MNEKPYDSKNKLDQTLKGILRNPESFRPDVGYSLFERKIQVVIEAPILRSSMGGVEKIADKMYSGNVSLDYLHELAAREDVLSISSKQVKQVRF